MAVMFMVWRLVRFIWFDVLDLDDHVAFDAKA